MPGGARPLRLVAAYLRQAFPRQLTPKQIAANLPGLSHATVKKLLQREIEAGSSLVVRTERGRYRAFVDAEILRAVDIPDPEVHNLEITAPLSPSTPGGGLRPDLSGPGAMTVRTLYWRGRQVTIQYHGGKARGKSPRHPKIAVYLRSSGQPLGVQEFEAYWSWCAGILSSYGVDPDSPKVLVRQQEVNCDIPLKRISLRGTQSLSIHGFRRGLLKVYNKPSLGVMRSEVCMWPTEIHPKEAVALMEEAFFRNATRPLPRPSFSERELV